MTLRECYRTLDVPPGASMETIKRAYRRLARRWHPDRHVGDSDRRAAAAEQFKTINAAYSRLSASSERERAALKRSAQSRSASPPPASRFRARPRRSSAASRRSASYRAAKENGRAQTKTGRDGRRQVASSSSRPGGREGALGGSASPSETGRRARGTSRTTDAGMWLQGWSGVALVAGAVGLFCLGLLRSTTLAGMLAWTAMWAVIAVGTFTLALGSSPERFRL